jgi:hypothetical protein
MRNGDQIVIISSHFELQGVASVSSVPLGKSTQTSHRRTCVNELMLKFEGFITKTDK